MHDFEFSTHNNFRLLPPSKSGLMEHVKRATCRWLDLLPMFVTLHSLTRERLGWTTDNGQYFPKWQDIENPVDPLVITFS